MSTRIRFAGAFGSFIDPKYAMVLGLIPDCDLAEVKAVGNAAGTGALMALLNRDHRREIEQTVQRIEKIETALEPHFQQHLHQRHGAAEQGRPVPETGRRRHFAAAQDGQRRQRGRRGNAAPALARGTRGAPRPRLSRQFAGFPKFICMQMFLVGNSWARETSAFARNHPETMRALSEQPDGGRKVIRGRSHPRRRIPMSFMNDLKKFAIARLKQRRHRQTVMFLDSLPSDLKKDIGWTGPNRRYE